MQNFDEQPFRHVTNDAWAEECPARRLACKVNFAQKWNYDLKYFTQLEDSVVDACFGAELQALTRFPRLRQRLGFRLHQSDRSASAFSFNASDILAAWLKNDGDSTAGVKPRQPRPRKNATVAAPPPRIDAWGLALLLLGPLLTALWIGGLAWLVTVFLGWHI